MTHSGPSNVAWVLTLLLSGCCFDALSPTPSSVPIPPPSSPGTGTGPLLPGGASGGLGTPISYGPGSSDPTFAQGFGGGPIQGTTLDPSCYAGHYPTSPSHVLTLTGAIGYVRVMAYSARGTDLTLLVRQPNGVVLCNDDSDGLNPMIEITAPPAGEYQVYVGNFSAPGPEPYELGVSSTTTVTPSSMHFAPTSTVTTGATAAIGTLLLTGTASVTSLSGSIPGVAVGTACTYTQTRVLATGGPGVVDCRWQLTCGGVDLYGGSDAGGYQPCSDPSWVGGVLAMDSNTSGTDTDPTFLFSGTSITVGDDATGTYGAFTVILSASPSAGPPVAPIPFPQASS